MRRMGLVKSDDQRKANQLQRKSAIAASDHEIINGPKPTTWSVRMPAYAGTSLCPDPELRGGDTIGENKDNQEASEQLPKAQERDCSLGIGTGRDDGRG